MATGNAAMTACVAKCSPSKTQSCVKSVFLKKTSALVIHSGAAEILMLRKNNIQNSWSPRRTRWRSIFLRRQWQIFIVVCDRCTDAL